METDICRPAAVSSIGLETLTANKTGENATHARHKNCVVGISRPPLLHNEQMRSDYIISYLGVRKRLQLGTSFFKARGLVYLRGQQKYLKNHFLFVQRVEGREILQNNMLQ